jgi:hypothetical protein
VKRDLPTEDGTTSAAIVAQLKNLQKTANTIAMGLAFIAVLLIAILWKLP